MFWSSIKWTLCRRSCASVQQWCYERSIQRRGYSKAALRPCPLVKSWVCKPSAEIVWKRRCKEWCVIKRATGTSTAITLMTTATMCITGMEVITIRIMVLAAVIARSEFFLVDMESRASSYTERQKLFMIQTRFVHGWQMYFGRARPALCIGARACSGDLVKTNCHWKIPFVGPSRQLLTPCKVWGSSLKLRRLPLHPRRRASCFSSGVG
mmetsp:Transcript_66762/g.157224  ORF Transcript_66762/g.157224 Transcript_66762/m.157224 type:complete len:210 (-) Transcript_66762:104-733(-)